MHQHDQDLIMALAEETLGDASAAAARAAIEACPQCAGDLELQRFALGVLSDAPPAQLTEMESARLRRDIRQELGLAKEKTFEPTKQRRRLPIAALATAAAVLVAVVVVGPGLELIRSDDTADTLVTAETAPSTAAASFEEAPSAGAGLTQNDNAESSFAPQTTFAAAETTTLPPLNPTLLAYYAVPPDLEALRRSIADDEYDEESARWFALKDAGDTVTERDLSSVAACIVVTLSNTDEFSEGFQVAQGRFDDRDVIYVVYLAESLEESVLIVQDAATCEELGRAGP